MSIALMSCNKDDESLIAENQSPTERTTNTENRQGDHISSVGELEESKRAYEWIDDKLDWSQSGSGCKVASVFHSEDESIDLFVPQVLKLIEAGDDDLNNYFLNNDLSFEFPTFYTGDFLTDLENGELNLDFQFPYLLINNSQNELEEVYNYESTLGDNEVLTQLQAAGGYDKAVVFSDEPGTVWDFTTDGDNCKVSSVSFHSTWLADNPSYTFAPNIEGNIDEVDFDEDNILITTLSGDQYGVRF